MFVQISGFSFLRVQPNLGSIASIIEMEVSNSSITPTTANCFSRLNIANCNAALLRGSPHSMLKHANVKDDVQSVSFMSEGVIDLTLSIKQCVKDFIGILFKDTSPHFDPQK